MQKNISACMGCFASEMLKPRLDAWNVEAQTWCLKRRSPDLMPETLKPRPDAWNVEAQTYTWNVEA